MFAVGRDPIRIDAVYDFLCPWCFVAKRHLDLAIDQISSPAFTVRWHQFMLYPDFDRAGHDFLAFFKSRYGEELQVPMWAAIRAVAEPVGINFAFERISRGPASLDGHRMVRWAQTINPDAAPAMIEDIASSFFEHARIIDDEFLIELAERHGFDRDLARRHLASDADMTEPFAETAAWRTRGVTSMPHFVLTFPAGQREIIKQTSVDVFADALLRDAQINHPSDPVGDLNSHSDRGAAGSMIPIEDIRSY